MSHDPLQKIYPNWPERVKYENKIKFNWLKILKIFYDGITNNREGMGGGWGILPPRQIGVS